MNWQSFWDSFKSAIHKNSDISTIDKFNYLNSLLRGNAARTVQGLTLKFKLQCHSGNATGALWQASVELLIRQTHERVKHSDVNNTLTTIQERFWILRGRQAVKRVLRCCAICKKLEGLSYPASYSPDLPNIRVSDDRPFTHARVDFAGPVYILANSASGNDSDKCYICLFTCATTHTVHLESTRNLTVECSLLAFRRFTSRRGLNL